MCQLHIIMLSEPTVKYQTITNDSQELKPIAAISEPISCTVKVLIFFLSNSKIEVTLQTSLRGQVNFN